MSFQQPLFLLLLLLVPVAAGLYLLGERGRGRAAQRFAYARLTPSVAPSRPGFRRHAPMLLYALALIALTVALAKPEATVAVSEERAAVVLATDTSGSMAATDVAPTRMQAVRKAALEFLDRAPDDLRVGTVVFNHEVRRIEPPSTDREPSRAVTEALRPSGGTATGEALASSLAVLERARGSARPRPPAAVILISDGASTHGRDPIPLARRAKRLKIPVYTVALGTDEGTIQVPDRDGTLQTRPVPPDRATMRAIARITGGKTFNASDGNEVSDVYKRLGSQVAKKDEQRQVTAAFAGGAAILLLAGGLLSLAWFGRLP
ncbi:MAG TPA: VWA domain-containing protein [Thermoleophilaceae bacterium]